LPQAAEASTVSTGSIPEPIGSDESESALLLVSTRFPERKLVSNSVENAMKTVAYPHIGSNFQTDRAKSALSARQRINQHHQFSKPHIDKIALGDEPIARSN